MSPLRPVKPLSPQRRRSLEEDVRAAGDSLDAVPEDDQARQERLEYLRGLMPEHRRRPGRRRIFTILLLVIVVAAAGVWWFIYRDRTPVAQPTKQAATSTTAPDAKPVFKHYDSDTYGLGFDYPQDWTVTDGTNALTVVSPAMELQTIAGSKQHGRIVLTIQSKTAVVAGFAKGNGLAVLDSEKVQYTKPTPNQRAQTYLSFVRYADTPVGSGDTEDSSSSDSSDGSGEAAESLNGLNAVIVTGDFGYQAGQAVPQTDIQKGDPHIVVSFLSCNNTGAATTKATNTTQDCSGNDALTVPVSLWKQTSFANPVRTMLTSLSVQ